MTLRDFHGGNIPSDLPLPSAPGMVVERKNHDRPGSGGWMGSSLHRGYSGDRGGFSRQGSGNFARSYEEKISYLPNPANIGRNYDEDERKPVDGHNRRGQNSDFFEEPIYEQRQIGHERLPERHTLENRAVFTPSKLDMRERHPQEESSPAPVNSSTFRIDGLSHRPNLYQQDSSVQPFVSQDHAVHYSLQHVPPHSPYHVQEPPQPWRQNSLSQQPVTPGTVMGSGTGVQNVWTARRDGDYGRTYPSEYGVSDGASLHSPATQHSPGPRIAQSSALEKVSSGRWNSRIVQPSIETQVYAGDYGQSYGGSYEGGSSYPPHDNSRFPADYERSVYADRAAYLEAGRGIDSLSLRDSRLSVEKGNLQDSRREQYLEGRGSSQSELYRYMEDRHAFGEIGHKGIAGPRDTARFVGSRDGVFPESGNSRHTSDRFNSNEAVPYPEARSTVQGNSGWAKPELSSRREYGETIPSDASMGLSSEFEKRGVMERDYGLTHRSYGAEHQKERGLQVDGPYHVSGKEDIEYLNSPYLKSREDFSHEVSETVRSGRFHDRSRGADADQSHPVRLHSPGSVHMLSHDSVATANSLPVEEGKGTYVDRPKLKLLPRTRPLHVDPLEEAVQEDSDEGFEVVQSGGLSRTEGATSSGSGTPASAGIAGAEEPVRTIERPKLSLKPRSQPVEFVPAGSGSVKERMSVFGGARPRELVLKERGVDESVIVGTDLTPSSAPSPMSSVRTPIEGNRTSSGGIGYGNEKQEKLDESSRRADQHEIRMGRQDSGRLERLDSRGRREHIDFEKKDERRGSEHRHHQEKRESDRPDVDKQESWRRPVEVSQSPLPVGEVSSGGSARLIQSAAELAQAFSRSTSFGSSAQGYVSQRSPGPRTPGPIFGMGPETPGVRSTDVPFSRLTEAASPGPRDFHVSGVQAGYRRTSAF
ncbi:hypothetical protein L7F22_028401 [Adiantum nelumboides]|nr:hypothetical protein [Adiantum nelumboides]